MGICGRLRRGDVADVAAGAARRLRDRDRRDPFSAGVFLEVVFDRLKLKWQDHVEIDQRFFRPAEVDLLIGDASKAKRQLGWTPKVKFERLAELMIEADLETGRARATQQRAGNKFG